jgi:hypothetical protein
LRLRLLPSEGPFNERRYAVFAFSCLGSQVKRVEPASAKALPDGHLDLLGLGAGLSLAVALAPPRVPCSCKRWWPPADWPSGRSITRAPNDAAIAFALLNVGVALQAEESLTTLQRRSSLAAGSARIASIACAGSRASRPSGASMDLNDER